MKRILIILSLLFCFSCKPLHQVVVEHVTETHVVDSLVIRDSIVTIPKEVYTNIAWSYDTLTLETSLAKAECWVDSLWLRGTISNKQQVIYKYVEVEKVRDSIVYEEKPTPYPVEVMVEKPLNNKLLIWAILSSGGLLFMLWFTFRKKFSKLFSQF